METIFLIFNAHCPDFEIKNYFLYYWPNGQSFTKLQKAPNKFYSSNSLQDLYFDRLP